MINKSFSLLLAFIIMSFAACSGGGETDSGDKANTTQSTNTETLNPISADQYKVLFENANFIDVLFYGNAVGSMSASDQASVRNFMSYISPTAPTKTKGCKANGRFIFQNSGEIILEADFYVENDCAFFKIFMDGGEFYNAIKPEGIGQLQGFVKQLNPESFVAPGQ